MHAHKYAHNAIHGKQYAELDTHADLYTHNYKHFDIYRYADAGDADVYADEHINKNSDPKCYGYLYANDNKNVNNNADTDNSYDTSNIDYND